jgi:DNA adenine methylase
MTFYQQVATQYPRLMGELTALHNIYEHNYREYARLKTLTPKQRVPNDNEPLYYQLRDMYNGTIPSPYLDATLYYYINKTAYSGMIRYNAQGQYNVPFGRYVHFTVDNITPQHSALLQNAQIFHTDFEDIFAMAQPDDFMFLDPPYDCVFHDYGNMATNFNEDEHRRLAAAIQNSHCRILMVIGRTPLTEELYAGHIVAEYPVRYSVNIRNRFDAIATHIVVTNY